ncbi:MAG: chloride channel protein [Candidatus Nanopelagicales bacterium]
MVTESASTARPGLVPVAVTAVLSLPLGLGVLFLVQGGIAAVWERSEDQPLPAWYVLAVPVVAALLVYAVRRLLGDDGHSPLGGIKVAALTPQQYVNVILAILLTLLGGLVLGPEVAMVSTGGVTGVVVARLAHSEATEKLAMVGALAALLALFVAPVLTGSVAVEPAQQTLTWSGLLVAVPAAAAATLAVQLSRAGGWLLLRAAGAGPSLWALVLTALVVGGAALAMRAATGADVMFVVTSGEGQIRALAQETSVATVLAVLVAKVVAYGFSLGAGFRGGPFFPAMFVGAAAGIATALAIPGGLPVGAAAVTGVVAATVATAPMGWRTVVILGAVIGFAFGSWPLVPVALVGAVIARLLPRWGDLPATSDAPASPGGTDDPGSGSPAGPAGPTTAKGTG